jgi:hypothetical protein
MNREDVDHGLTQRITTAFAWRDWGEPRSQDSRLKVEIWTWDL